MKKIVIWFIVIVTSIILLFDIFALSKGSSISSVITEYSHKWPIIAFAWGFLMGHWYGK